MKKLNYYIENISLKIVDYSLLKVIKNEIKNEKNNIQKKNTFNCFFKFIIYNLEKKIEHLKNTKKT